MKYTVKKICEKSDIKKCENFVSYSLEIFYLRGSVTAIIFRRLL